MCTLGSRHISTVSNCFKTDKFWKSKIHIAKVELFFFWFCAWDKLHKFQMIKYFLVVLLFFFGLKSTYVVEKKKEFISNSDLTKFRLKNKSLISTFLTWQLVYNLYRQLCVHVLYFYSICNLISVNSLHLVTPETMIWQCFKIIRSYSHTKVYLCVFHLIKF